MGEEIANIEKVAVTEKDWFLQNLVSTVNRSGGNVAITVLSHGFLISGILIGGKEYFEAIANLLSNNNPEDELFTAIKDIGESTYKKTSDLSKPGYIHLKEAKYFSTIGQPVPSNSGLLWRGRLTEISGYSFGILAPIDQG